MSLEQNRDIMLGMLKVGENGNQILSILNQIVPDTSSANEETKEPTFLTDEQIATL